VKSKFEDPILAIKIRMLELDLKQKDMTKYMGCKSHISEVLNYKRKLSLPMIRKLHSALGIRLTILIKDYELIE